MTDLLPKLLTTEKAAQYVGYQKPGQFRQFAKRHDLKPFDKETRPHMWKRSEIDRIIDPDLEDHDAIMEMIKRNAG
jgi:hypothetical protein